MPRVNVAWFNIALADFAKVTGARQDKQVILVLDRAGWHVSEQVVIPTGIDLEKLPPYSPELQPAERLWRLTDEPMVNQNFSSLEQLELVLAERCCILSEKPELFRGLTNYHWWPKERTGAEKSNFN